MNEYKKYIIYHDTQRIVLLEDISWDEINSIYQRIKDDGYSWKEYRIVNGLND